MSSNNKILKNKVIYSKERLNELLYKLSVAYKKIGGRKMRAQIVLVGGASILGVYHFRNMTDDIDMFGDFLKEAVNKITDENNLPEGWINTDFINTQSYTDKLYEFADFYKTFNQVLEVRIIKGAALIAMKLNASRLYKNDLSDIVGILNEERNNGNEIGLDEIKRTYTRLYKSYETLDTKSRKFIEEVINNKSFNDRYYKIVRSVEKENRVILKNAISKNKNISEVKDKFQSTSSIVRKLKNK